MIESWIARGSLTVDGPVRSLDDLVERTQSAVVGERLADRTLRELVGLAAADDLAARIVLRRILPGVVSQARRWQDHGTHADPVDTAIGAGWIAVRRFDPRRRPNRIAPALVSDTMWIAFRRHDRRLESKRSRPTSDLSGVAAPEPHLDPTTALAATVRAARRAGVAQPDLDVVVALASSGSAAEVAHSLGVTVRTVRNRRDAAAYRIRRALGPEWADWDDPVTAAA